MSEPVTVVVPAVKPANIVDNVNDRTPDPATPPGVAAVPAPPRPDEGGLDALATQVAALGATVETLSELVTGTLAAKDADPRRVPWTHRGGSRKGPAE